MNIVFHPQQIKLINEDKTIVAHACAFDRYTTLLYACIDEKHCFSIYVEENDRPKGNKYCMLQKGKEQIAISLVYGEYVSGTIIKLSIFDDIKEIEKIIKVNFPEALGLLYLSHEKYEKELEEELKRCNEMFETIAKRRPPSNLGFK